MTIEVEQISRSANQQIGKSADRQIGKSATLMAMAFFQIKSPI
jgi:hypothetical protein